MDVVEAIDLWIDEQIDDLSDDELERVLSILDVVSTSPLADEEPDELSDGDIEELAELVGVSAARRDQARAILRAALLDEEIEFDVVFADLDDGAPAERPAPDPAPRFGERITAASADGVFSADLDEDDPVFAPDAGDSEPDNRPFEVDGRDDAAEVDDENAEAGDEDDGAGGDEDDAAGDDTFTADEGVEPGDHADDEDLENGDPEDRRFDGDRPDDPETDGDGDVDEDMADRAERDDDIDADPDLIGDDIGSVAITQVFDHRALDEDGFLSDLATARRTDEVEAVTPTLVLPEWTKEPRAVPLAEFDELGPTFLPESETAVAAPRRVRANQILLPMFLIVGLAVFGWGTLRLIDSLDADESAQADTATTPTAEPAAGATTSPTPSIAPSPSPDDAADAADPAAEGALAATDATEQVVAPVDPARLALRLVTGEVIVIDPGANPDDPVAEVQSIVTYDLGDDERPPARDVVWGDFGLAVADDDGSVVVVGPDGDLEPVVVYDGDSDTGEATELAPLPGAIAVLTDTGNIVVVAASPDATDAVEDTSDGEGADADGAAETEVDGPEIVWAADDAGSPATAITSVGARIPFALEGGNARMIDTEAGNAVITVWLASVLPPVDHVQGAPDAVLLGNGEGAVTRYRLGELDPEVDGERVQPVWAPGADEDQAAIAYKSIGERAVIVTAAGTVLLTDGETAEEPLWDPAETETRALYAAGDDSAVIVLLETGSVLRIPLDGESPIESLWDVTDSTLAPASQLVVECCTTD